jgi:hypothetical protein
MKAVELFVNDDENDLPVSATCPLCYLQIRAFEMESPAPSEIIFALSELFRDHVQQKHPGWYVI